MQLARFALVGTTVALVYVAGYLLLLEVGINQPLANALAYLIAILAQYLGQAAYTFDKPINDRTQIGRFIVMTGLGFLTAAAITGQIGPFLNASNWAAAVAVILILPIQNHVIMPLWVFSKSPKTDGITQ
jgi:putative flippase GtrA